MNCKTFENEIPNFLKGEMPIRTGEEFLRHNETCAACREELSIQFLVSVGLERLESGETFHLNRELRNRIATAAAHLRIRRKLRQWVCFLDLISIAAAVVLLTQYVF